jgi:hypothetical protein
VNREVIRITGDFVQCHTNIGRKNMIPMLLILLSQFSGSSEQFSIAEHSRIQKLVIQVRICKFRMLIISSKPLKT